MDLLVPADLEDSQPYQVAPKATAEAGNVRQWIAGEDLIFASLDQGLDLFSTPLKMLDAIRWMPPDRADRVARRYFEKTPNQKEGEQVSQHIHRRCGCRDPETGRQFGKSCPS